MFGWYVGIGISVKEVDECYWNIVKWLLGLLMFIIIVFIFVIVCFGLLFINVLGGEIDEVIGIVKNVFCGNLNLYIC